MEEEQTEEVEGLSRQEAMTLRQARAGLALWLAAYRELLVTLGETEVVERVADICECDLDPAWIGFWRQRGHEREQRRKQRLVH